MEGVPRRIKTLATKIIVQIACGIEHSIALTNDGEIYGWGNNAEGQLALGCKVELVTKPTKIPNLAAIPITFIACGGYHTIAISKSGKFFLTLVHGATQYKYIQILQYYTNSFFYSFKTGIVFAWGRNTFGQLGLSDTVSRSLPCQLRTLRNSKVCYAACGEEFSVFLTIVSLVTDIKLHVKKSENYKMFFLQEGGVFTCGAGMYGQLGHGTNVSEVLPRQVMELMGSTVTQVNNCYDYL
jgi:E3 ubiquitin-protein ligase HERC4